MKTACYENYLRQELPERKSEPEAYRNKMVISAGWKITKMIKTGVNRWQDYFSISGHSNQ